MLFMNYPNITHIFHSLVEGCVNVLELAFAFPEAIWLKKNPRITRSDYRRDL